MITCPNPACKHENIDGTQFCELCGEELPDATTASTAGVSNVKCPQCGHLNAPDNMVCEACGANLQPTAVPTTEPAFEMTPFDNFAASLQNPPPPVPQPIPIVPVLSTIEPDLVPSPPQSPGDLKPGLVKLVVEQGQTVGSQFVLGDEQIEVGREDEEEDIFPDIDLSDQDAGYVHRRHATLRFDNGHLMVTHLGGANKTRVNNKPIPDNTPTEAKLGDKISFGKVVLRLLPV